MHLSEQVGTYYVMQHKATPLSFVPTEILWEATRDHRMDQEAKQKKLFGDQFEHLRDIAISSLVDITGLKIRAGQINMFYCGEATVVSNHHSTAPHAFAYETAGLDDLATMSYINECNVGIFVDLVIHATQVEARLSNEQTLDEQPFLLVHGYDMESVPTGSLRFWRYEDGDIAEGKTYIVRGLKVVDDKWWCDGAGYVPKGDGSKTVVRAFELRFPLASTNTSSCMRAVSTSRSKCLLLVVAPRKNLCRASAA